MATGDNTASVPFPRLSQTRREGIPHVPGTTKSWPRRGAGARIIAKEHGLTPAGDAHEIRPSTAGQPYASSLGRTAPADEGGYFVVLDRHGAPEEFGRLLARDLHGLLAGGHGVERVPVRR